MADHKDASYSKPLRSLKIFQYLPACLPIHPHNANIFIIIIIYLWIFLYHPTTIIIITLIVFICHSKLTKACLLLCHFEHFICICASYSPIYSKETKCTRSYTHYSSSSPLHNLQDCTAPSLSIEAAFDHLSM